MGEFHHGAPRQGTSITYQQFVEIEKAASGSTGSKQLANATKLKGTWTRRNTTPVLFLNIDGRDCADLLRITTDFQHKVSVKKAAETTWTMRNDDRKLLEDSRTFLNRVWRFRFGYFNDLSPIIHGIVREIAPVYGDKRSVKFTLYDASLNISQTTAGKNWGRISSSDIAKKIAAIHGMEALVTETNDIPKKAFIQPPDVNDLQYLRDLAADLDFEVFVEGSPPILFFRKKPYDMPPLRRLIYYDDASEFSNVVSFTPKMKSLGPLATSSTNGDGKQSKSAQGDDRKLAGRISIDPVTGQRRTAAGDRQGTSISAEQFTQILIASDSQGTSVYETEVLLALKNQHELSKFKKPIHKSAAGSVNTRTVASVARQQLLDATNEASSEHLMTPSIWPGNVYEWAGVDKAFSGKWYADEGTYGINGSGGKTSITWKRNAANSGKEKAKNVNNQAPNEPGTRQKTVKIDGNTGEVSSKASAQERFLGY